MGVISTLTGALFGQGGNVLKDTAEVFMENTEAAAAREAAWRAAALAQFGTEFARPRRGLFDRVMDAVNRLPRPALALGTLGLFAAAMVDPVWFAARMQGIALVPEPLWWLMGAIVSFYFGARSQAKGQDFQRALAETMARTGRVVENVAALEALGAGTGAGAGAGGPVAGGRGAPSDAVAMGGAHAGPAAEGPARGPALDPAPTTAPSTAPTTAQTAEPNPALADWQAHR